MNEQIKYKGYTIEVTQDESPYDPRENDNLGTMAFFHKRYTLGDKNHGIQSEEYSSWDAMLAGIEEKNGPIVYLPVYMYDHSGITINTTGFGAIDGQRWDWGQIGFIYITFEKIRKEYSWKKLTPARIEKIKEYLRCEVKEYDQFLTGDVYGYKVLDSKGNEIDDGSCWGFYGHEHKTSGLLEYAQNAIDCEIRSRKEAKTKKLKALITGKAPLDVRQTALAV